METPVKKKNWFRRHKALTASLLVVLLAGGLEAIDQHAANDAPAATKTTLNQKTTNGTSASAGKSVTSTSSSSTSATSSSTDGSTTPAPAVAGSTDKMTLAGSTVTLSSNGSATVTGHITNNQNSAHGATIQATFYDSNNKVIGIAKGTVSSIDPAAYKSFTLTTSQNVSGYTKVIVEVVNIS
jgi:hypothetical protein